MTTDPTPQADVLQDSPLTELRSAFYAAERALEVAAAALLDAEIDAVPVPDPLAELVAQAVEAVACPGCPDPWCGFAHDALTAFREARDPSPTVHARLVYDMVRELPALSACEASDAQVAAEATLYAAEALADEELDSSHWSPAHGLPRSPDQQLARSAWEAYCALLAAHGLPAPSPS